MFLVGQFLKIFFSEPLSQMNQNWVNASMEGPL